MAIDKEYQKMIEQIKLDNEELTTGQIKEILKKQKSDRDELLDYVYIMFGKYAIDNLISMNSVKLNSIKKELTKILSNNASSLTRSEIAVTTELLSNVFKETYYKNAFILDSGIKIDLDFNLIRQEFIDAIVNKEFAGELFSDRIWTNKTDMMNKLQLEIIEAMKGNRTVQQVSNNIKKQYDVQAYESLRLARTEMARVEAQANEEIARSTGIKKQLFLATLDNKTSEICQFYDGQEFDIGDSNKPIPPLHPFAVAYL
ncbi:minor capsid protein [Clostridium grantii]|uniref:Phage putative head morphogenesis protein, SPP1 gp7 family n=1 Tax=Clostridium grantii DSM 8605 TaxID=1121316 RepID=A0A1M5SCG7_9CLOT|nr:minor capsid protein [Clostridium grantii]SHH36312.1 phage putative head morphogenesis protein, SPP1 gp7 family [Clostridium grantii DSM 8605]